MFGRTSYLGLPAFGTTCSSQCDLSYCDDSVVLVGANAGTAQRGTQIVGIGVGAAASNSGDSVVALGTDAAASNSGDYVSAVGDGAASSNEGSEVVALGHNAGSQADVGGLLGRAWKAVTTGETTGSNSNAPNWGQIASSADGNVIVAGAYNGECNNGNWGSESGRVVVSKDSGVTWTLTVGLGSNGTGYGDWSSVATDYSGTNIYAINRYIGEVWKSSNSGSNWEEIAPASGSSNWRSISCSSNGQTVVLGEDGGDSDLYVSLDGGCNWQLQDISGTSWRSVVISADGKRALVGDTNNSNLQVGVLSNSNWSWTPWNAVDPSNAGQPASGFWNQLAISANGKYMYATDDDNDSLWRSKDSGSNWQRIGSNLEFRAVACSADGKTVLRANTYGYPSLFAALSTNYGDTFTDLSQLYYSALVISGARSVCMDAAGTKFAFVGSNTPIFINPLPSNIIAVGANAGSNNIGSDVILIGTSAGASNAGFNAIAIGSNAGIRSGDVKTFSDSFDAFGIYLTDGLFPTKSNSVSIGTGAGTDNFGIGMISIGENAGSKTAGGNTVAIGKDAGVCLSGSVMFSTVAIGEGAASECAGVTYGLVAIGSNAGKGDRTTQGSYFDPYSLLNGTVSIGNRAGQGNCAPSVNIGTGAGVTNSTYNAIAIGSNAGGGVNAEWGYADYGWMYGAAVSSNGEYMYSTQDYANNGDGYILRNTNYGVSSEWETVQGDYFWRDIACTGDGSNVIACEWDDGAGGYLWFSIDRGTNGSWDTEGGFDQSGAAVHLGLWRSVTVAQNNRNIIFAGESNGGGTGSLWKSTDGGATLTQVAEVGTGNWRSVRCDAVGGYVIALDSYNSNAWVRDPSGTWTNVTSLPQSDSDNVPEDAFWASAISSNGQYMYACGSDDGEVWGSSNYGSNWTRLSSVFSPLPSNTGWRSVACSGDGQVVYAGVGSGGNQYVYRSTDAGLKWAVAGQVSISSSWAALACDSDTGRLVLGATRWNNDGLWTTTVPEMTDTVAIGSEAGSNSIGYENVFVGLRAGISNLGYNCIAIGKDAGYGNQGNNNIYLGKNPSGANLTPNFGSSNMFLVYRTGGNGIATYTDLSEARFGIGTEPGSYALNVSGDAIVSGTITGTVVPPPSDRTLKQEIVTTTLGLDFVKSLKPVDYKFIDKPQALRHGFIAQEVQEVAPELVHTNPHTEKLGLDITDIIAPLVKAVQELAAEVTDLKAQLARLQA